MKRAAEVDLGFDPFVLAQMMRTIDRFDDDELPIDEDDIDTMRTFFHRWARELERDAET